MAVIFFSVQEVVNLLVSDYDTIIKQIQRGTLKAMEVDKENKGGTKEGKQYKVALEDLPVKFQNKYWDNLREELIRKNSIEDFIKAKSDDNLSDEDREEIHKWKRIFEEWNKYRFFNKGKRDESGVAIRDAVQRSYEFIDAWNWNHPELQLTHKTMIRRYAQYKEKGDVALIDKRGRLNKGKNSIPEAAWKVFCTYYLNEKRWDEAMAYKYTNSWAKKNGIEIPSLKTFSRHVKSDIPDFVLCMRRMGKEAFNREYAPFLERSYKDLRSNDVWIADNHTLDFMTNVDGKPRRMYLTLFIDGRSRKPMCWGLFDHAPNADDVLSVLKQGIKQYGCPWAIYTDNGREFLTIDITGTLGYRKQREIPEEERVPSIFEEMGISIFVAKPARGQEKPVERTFRTVKNWFSKLFDSYIGGNIMERPKNAKDGVKHIKSMKTDEEIHDLIGKFIEGVLPFQPHSGNGMNGMTPNDTYQECLEEKRVVTDEQIRYMMARRSKALTVRENGITINFGYAKLTYYVPEMVTIRGRKVFAKYDASDLSVVDICDMYGIRIFEDVPEKKLGKFMGQDVATREALEQNARYVKKVKSLEREWYENNTTDVYDPIDLMIEEAESNLANCDDHDKGVIYRPMMNHVKMAVGAENIEFEDDGDSNVQNIVDIKRMVENVKKMRGEI